MGDDPVLLCKFVERQYVDDVLHGRLYMKPLSGFPGEENNAARRDPREGHTFILQESQFILKVNIAGNSRVIPTLNIGHYTPDSCRVNVFCMSAIPESQLDRPLDRRYCLFGDMFVRMRDTKEFCKRVRAAGQKTEHELRMGPVKYVDMNTYSGPLGPFTKSSEFSYQREFRIALFPGTGSPYFLNVGDLTDIAVAGALADVTEDLSTEQ